LSGLGALGLFILLLARAFGQIGKAMAKLKTSVPRNSTTPFVVWGLGVTMLVHVVGWFGVSYFDQMYVIWFLELAAAVSVTEEILRRRKAARVPEKIAVPRSEFVLTRS